MRLIFCNAAREISTRQPNTVPIKTKNCSCQYGMGPHLTQTQRKEDMAMSDFSHELTLRNHPLLLLKTEFLVSMKMGIRRNTYLKKMFLIQRWWKEFQNIVLAQQQRQLKRNTEFPRRFRSASMWKILFFYSIETTFLLIFLVFKKMI